MGWYPGLYVIELLLGSCWIWHLDIRGFAFHTTRRLLIERKQKGEDVAKEVANELANAKFRAELMAVSIKHLKQRAERPGTLQVLLAAAE